MAIPSSIEFEKGLIVGVLSDPALLPQVSLVVSPEDFFVAHHRDIFRAITDLDIENIDSLTVEESIHDPETKTYFKTLVSDSDSLLPGLSNILFYAENIKSKAKLREGLELGRDITAICYEDNIDSAEAMIKLEQRFSTFLRSRVNDVTYESTKEVFDEFMATLGTRINDEGGTKSGYPQVDLILHKLEGLLILAARPSVGKTAFAANIARNVGEEKPVVFFSLEQPREHIFERMLASESGVSLEAIRTGAYIANKDYVRNISQASSKLSSVFENIHIDDTPAVSSSYIASVSRQKYFEKGEIGLIIVDYLHIMKLGVGNLVDTLGNAVKELRALGRELGCPVILLSQLSRQPETASGEDGKKTKRRPELSDLRSSGEIEQSADVVMFLHRDSYYDQTGYMPDEDTVEVIVKKNRNGRQGIATLTWYPPLMKFADTRYMGGGDEFKW